MGLGIKQRESTASSNTSRIQWMGIYTAKSMKFFERREMDNKDNIIPNRYVQNIEKADPDIFSIWSGYL